MRIYVLELSTCSVSEEGDKVLTAPSSHKLGKNFETFVDETFNVYYSDDYISTKSSN
jgi:hypothetical protein